MFTSSTRRERNYRSTGGQLLFVGAASRPISRSATALTSEWVSRRQRERESRFLRSHRLPLSEGYLAGVTVDHHVVSFPELAL